MNHLCQPLLQSSIGNSHFLNRPIKVEEYPSRSIVRHPISTTSFLKLLALSVVLKAPTMFLKLMTFHGPTFVVHLLENFVLIFIRHNDLLPINWAQLPLTLIDCPNFAQMLQGSPLHY